MDSLVQMIKSGFDFFVAHDLFGISLMWWFIGLAVLGLVVSFLKGGKSND